MTGSCDKTSMRYFDVYSGLREFYSAEFIFIYELELIMVLGERKPAEKLDCVSHRHVRWS